MVKHTKIGVDNNGNPKNDSEYDSMCLSNFESDINAIRLNKRGGNMRFRFGLGGNTTNDEGGITIADDSATDPEMEFKNILNVLNNKK